MQAMQTAKQRYTLWACTACSRNHIFAARLLVKLSWKPERCAGHSANGIRQRLTRYVNREVKRDSKWRSPAQQAVKETMDSAASHTGNSRPPRRPGEHKGEHRLNGSPKQKLRCVTWTRQCGGVACWNDLLQVHIVKTWHKEKGQPFFLHRCTQCLLWRPSK